MTLVIYPQQAKKNARTKCGQVAEISFYHHFPESPWFLVINLFLVTFGDSPQARLATSVSWYLVDSGGVGQWLQMCPK